MYRCFHLLLLSRTKPLNHFKHFMELEASSCPTASTHQEQTAVPYQWCRRPLSDRPTASDGEEPPDAWELNTQSEVCDVIMCLTQSVKPLFDQNKYFLHFSMCRFLSGPVKLVFSADSMLPFMFLALMEYFYIYSVHYFIQAINN